MTQRDPIPKDLSELGASLVEELDFDKKEMAKISEQGVACFLEALKDEANVLTETVNYQGIPHSNGLRTPSIILGLRDRRLSTIDIKVPRKDQSTAITVTAHDDINPTRRFIFSEVEEFGDEAGGFVITDTDWENAEKANRAVDLFMDKHEIAHWLYRQAGVEQKDIVRKLKSESDPVQDAAHLAGMHAEQVLTQRQVKVPINENLFFFGEEISVKAADEIALQVPSPASEVPVARPIRMYNVWVNAAYETERYGMVIETVAASFSPDNPLLIVPNPRSSISLSVETTRDLRSPEMAALFVSRKLAHQGNVANLFENIHIAMKSQNSVD